MPAFKLPPESPWSILTAYLASRGEVKKIEDIHEYLDLKRAKDQGAPFDSTRFGELKSQISELYFSKSDFKDYTTPDSPNVNSDLTARVSALVTYLDEILQKPTGEVSVAASISRANAANGRKKDAIAGLKSDIGAGKTFWKAAKDPYIEQQFVRIVLECLTNSEGRLSQAINLGEQIVEGHEAGWLKEYTEGLTRIAKFLREPNEREELSLLDLPYIIGEHRGATTFRGSTTGYYSDIDSFINGLFISMPEHEKYREGVDLVHNIVDPEFLNLSFTAKLSYINAKHNLGFTTEDIDVFGIAASTVSTVMRGFGIDEIDDRFKQYLHNSGDHSLRTCVTIASVRDTVINRLQYLAERGEITDEQFAEQKALAQQDACYLAKRACLHDMGEFLGEVLGNNLKGVSQKDEKALRKLRDKLEEHIVRTFAIPEVEERLAAGDVAKRWSAGQFQGHRRVAEAILGLSDDTSIPVNGHSYNYDSKFYETVFDIFERLNTQQDMTSLRQVGKINKEGQWQNYDNLAADDERYTLQYAYSKVTGHKFETTDPSDIAAYNREEYARRNSARYRERETVTAEKTGSPKPYAPHIDREGDLPKTSLPLDDFLLQKDINYDKSIFKRFVDQTTEDHKNLGPAEAKARQLQNEAMLHAVCYEVIHYSKKHARLSTNLDKDKVEKAARKAVAQGVAAAQLELAAHGIELQYLDPAELQLGQQRYRVGTINTSNVLGGVLGNPEKPDQLIDIAAKVVKPCIALFKAAKELAREIVLKPVNTLPQAILLNQNQLITEDDFRQLLQMASTVEAGGDVALSITGLLQTKPGDAVQVAAGTSDSKGLLDAVIGFDPKSLAILNPVVTYLLEGPKQCAEAIEKCYGHVLHKHSTAIAKKYGIDADTMKLLLTRDNIETGDFHKKPTDVTISGELAEKMYRYFDKTYSDKDPNPHPNKKLATNAEKSERYWLRELLEREAVKAENRRAQETSPAQKEALDEKRKRLIEARDLVGNDVLFGIRAEHNMGIRFGTIATFGGMFAMSDTGAEIPIPGTNLTINTSAIFGINLALAGAASFLCTAAEKIYKLAETHPVKRLMHDLPVLDFSEDGGVYIVKGKTVHHELTDIKKEDVEAALSKILHVHQKSPGMFGQVMDMLLACVATPVSILANRSTSNTLFSSQNTATTIDSAGAIARNTIEAFTGTKHPFSAAVQSGCAATATILFARSSILSMYMNKIADKLAEGKDPEFKTIQQQVAEELKTTASEPLLNCLRTLSNLTGLGHAAKSMVNTINKTAASASRMALKGIQSLGTSFQNRIGNDDQNDQDRHTQR